MIVGVFLQVHSHSPHTPSPPVQCGGGRPRGRPPHSGPQGSTPQSVIRVSSPRGRGRPRKLAFSNEGSHAVDIGDSTHPPSSSSGQSQGGNKNTPAKRSCAALSHHSACSPAPFRSLHDDSTSQLPMALIPLIRIGRHPSVGFEHRNYARMGYGTLYIEHFLTSQSAASSSQQQQQPMPLMLQSLVRAQALSKVSPLWDQAIPCDFTRALKAVSLIAKKALHRSFPDTYIPPWQKGQWDDAVSALHRKVRQQDLDIGDLHWACFLLYPLHHHHRVGVSSCWRSVCTTADYEGESTEAEGSVGCGLPSGPSLDIGGSQACHEADATFAQNDGEQAYKWLERLQASMKRYEAKAEELKRKHADLEQRKGAGQTSDSTITDDILDTMAGMEYNEYCLNRIGVNMAKAKRLCEQPGSSTGQHQLPLPYNESTQEQALPPKILPQQFNQLMWKSKSGYWEIKIAKAKPCIIEKAHRFILWVAKGPSLNEEPAGQDKSQPAMHVCDSKGCLNPKHIWWGTPSENKRATAEAYFDVITRSVPEQRDNEYKLPCDRVISFGNQGLI